MNTRRDGAVLRQIHSLFNLGVIRELTDGQLLERFSTGRGETAELAFAALVERHGAMVSRVCRALLHDPHDSQDAFQATFLILVKKARALWVRDSLGPWLYQVAFRTASCARSDALRRRMHERRKAESASLEIYENSTSERERMLHEEINRLPERYRVPIVLCDLEGHTCEEAARRMGRPVGMVKSWRSRGREQLRTRLTRLGLAPSAGVAVLLTAESAKASVPKVMAEETVHLAVGVLSGWKTAGEVSASVRLLVKGVLKTMFFCKLRTTACVLFATAFLAGGVGVVARVGSGDVKTEEGPARVQVPRPKTPAVEDSRESRPMTLRDAIRIGLENSERLRLISLGTAGVPVGGAVINPRNADVDAIVIAPLNADLNTQRFKTEIMAQVRSIEQQYWSLM